MWSKLPKKQAQSSLFRPYPMIGTITRRSVSHNTSVCRRLPEHILVLCPRQSFGLRKVLQEFCWVVAGWRAPVVLDPKLCCCVPVYHVVPLVVDTEKIYGLLNGLVRIAKWGLKQVLNDKGMSQAQIGMRLLYVQKANFDKEKVLRVWVTGPSGDLSVERSPLGAGGRPKAELHRPPPLPWAGRGCDQRHRARTGPTQTDVSLFDLLIYISASTSPDIARLLVIEFTIISHA